MNPSTDDLDRTTLVHFYRAVVAHTDVWRQRLDITTNWAVATTAGMITFTLGAAEPHFILLLALAFDSVFLLLEARRYQIYHLWRQRFIALNRFFIFPALAQERVDAEESRKGLGALAAGLAVTAPSLPLRGALGYRLRRNYGFIFALVVMAWVAKLSTHPQPAGGWREVVTRAHIGAIPGGAVLGAVGLYLAAATVLAFSCPTERTEEWS